MKLSLIVAMDEQGVIGIDGRLPWHLPADLAHFKSITMGKPIIMGRKTCETLKKPLPGRKNLVLTRNLAFQRDGFTVFTNKEDMLKALSDTSEAFVIGGSQIYRMFLDDVTTLHVTIVKGTFKGDTWFPGWPLPNWKTVTSTFREPDEINQHAMHFMTFERL